MIRCCSLLLLFLTVQRCCGQETGAYNTFRESTPYDVNGSGVRVALETTDYNKGTSDVAYLLINIDAANHLQIVSYGELKVQVRDTAGKTVAVILQAANKELTLEAGQQCAELKLNIQKGQKIESVQIKWGDSERIFLYS